MAHHHFKPSLFHNTLGSHPPVLTIATGDTVTTTTLDAGGMDESGKQAGTGGNPMTGPFFVAGARPGDTLAVTFDRLEIIRPWGFTGTRIAPNVLEPGYRPEFADEARRHIWKIDTTRGTARLAEACREREDQRLGDGEPISGPLADLDLPLRIHPGCFGVAPRGGQAISTATSGPHGGNMDYNGFVEGVTAFLPVSVEGALFHIGDVHATQGDGEIVGNGIEVPCEVTFTVRVIQGMDCHWPRGEDSTHIFAAGNARPLDQCVQHATTELIRWLRDGYDLDERTIHALFGQAVEYALGNMFDPAYTMVCRFPKSILEQIGAVRRER